MRSRAVFEKPQICPAKFKRVEVPMLSALPSPLLRATMPAPRALIALEPGALVEHKTHIGALAREVVLDAAAQGRQPPVDAGERPQLPHYAAHGHAATARRAAS
jgi:hypothetical protein